ncbi:MAG: hypothetical protein Q7J68_08470 [Thermoplasmata archaeon]|nr:hypothetical protein [Thermoplasmata archaeon]
MDALRKLIYDYPGVSDENKDTLSNLVTLVVFRHEAYRKALCELETFLNSPEMAIIQSTPLSLPIIQKKAK